MSPLGPGQGRPPARQSRTGQPVVVTTNEPSPDTEEGDTDQTWGNELHDPAPNSFRIGFLNHGGFALHSCRTPASQTGTCSCKNCGLRGFISQHRFDSIGLAESNLHWQNVPIEDRLPERTRGWWESLQISTAYYQAYQAKSATQYGGVTLLSINKAAHRVIQSGQDTAGLGRWAWTQYRGRNNVSLRVVTAYRPVRNTAGAMSVWSQQRSYFDEKDEDRCPRELFNIDLAAAIRSWLAAGDQLVVSLDANEDVRTGTVQQMFSALGLTEAIIDQHGAQGPSTFERGSCPIDGLFVSSTLLGLRCGYTGFFNGHRALWLDIPQTIAFGHDMPPIVRAAARRLKVEDPRVTLRYTTALKQYFHRHGLFARLEALYLQSTSPLTAELVAEWEYLDSMCTAGMLEAERKCRKLRMGEICWSLQYQYHRKRRDVWNLIHKKALGGYVGRKFLLRMAKAVQLEEHISDTLAEIKEARASIYREYKRTKKQALSLRVSWLQLLGEAKAASGLLSAEQVIKNMQRRETQRSNARMIRRVNDKLRSGSVTMVVAPDSDGNWTERTDKSDIETALLAENERRFNQAKDTPFMVPPLSDLIGPLGIGPHADAILDGTFVAPAGTDPYAVKLIAQLQKAPAAKEAPPMSLDLPLEEYRRGWTRARERTSSGPSGLHFGHYISGAADLELAEFHRKMVHIPYISGYSPVRWQQGIDVMLEKKKGNFRVTKLRAILLYESAFNQLNKKLGRDMMFTAERLQLVAKEQYGSRKGKAAIEQCLNKRLTFDLARQLKRALAMCSNDAKSCYDRIVHAIASLSMRRMGVEAEPIICMFTTIQNLEHYIRTVYGDSELSFTGKLWAVPIQGVGQGNGAGPQIWAVVSTPVLNMLRHEGYGVYFRTAITGTTISFVGYAFVDDTDLCVTTVSPDDTLGDVAHRMQQALDLWEGGIRATGGAIVPEKSHWYLINFIWRLGNWRYATEAEAPAQLRVRDCDGKVEVLERLSVSEARRTLGVKLAPDGNEQAQFKKLLDAAYKWNDQLRSGHLPRHLAWESMKTTILRTLQYPLPATTLTETQCDAIMKPILQAGLPCSGIVRKFPHKLVYGPIQYQGLGVPNLYTSQGIAHIERILKYSHIEDDITGQLIRASMEQLKLELGCNGPPLSLPYADFGVLATQSWLKHIWKFMDPYQMRIEDTSPDFPLSRTNDELLIPLFRRHGIRGYPLSRLNLCRLYLKAVTISDITTGCGTKITRLAWKGERDTTRTSSYQWAVQGLPSEQDWSLWRDTLKLVLHLQTSNTLRSGLGNWLATEAQCCWFFDTTTERLYQKQRDTITLYSRVPGRPSRAAVMKFSNASPASGVPPSASRATVERVAQTLWVTGYDASTVPANLPPVPETLRARLSLLVPDTSWAVTQVQMTDDGSAIAAAIRAGTCISVSDGSFKDQYGTAAWVIEAESSVNRCTGVNISPGAPSDQSAYRSEVSGLFGIATMIREICAFYNILDGTVQIGCDGLSALIQCTDPDYVVKPTSPQFDLITATRAMLQQCPVTWIPRHVIGHQDDDLTARLDRWALLNIEMDTRAKLHWAETVDQPREPQSTISGEPWSFWIKDKKICMNLHSSITMATRGQASLNYWESHGKYGQGTHSDIDWQATGQAMAKVKISRRHWVSKHSSGFCGTSKMMHIWKKRATNLCPRCLTEVEDASHVWTCQDPRAITVWQQSIANLEVWLKQQKTEPGITKVLCAKLLRWQSGGPIGNIPVSSFLGLQEVVTKQDALGWQSLLEGRPAIGWREVQHRYLQWIGSRRSGLRWLTALIQKLWDIAWDTWDHRNRVLHDTELSVARDIELQQITEQFQLSRAGLPNEVKALFRGGRTRLLQQQPAYQTAWLIRVQAARARNERRNDQQQENYRTEREGLQRWLGTTNN